METLVIVLRRALFLWALAFMASCIAVSAFQPIPPVPQLPPDASPMSSSQFTILLGVIASIVSTFATFAFQIYRENRNRRWDLEDRRIAREAADAKLDKQTEELRKIASLEAELTRARAEKVEVELKLAAAAQATRVAHVEQRVEAHGVNTAERLKHIGSAIDAVLTSRPRRSTDTPAAGQVLAEVRATKVVVDETLKAVEEVKDVVTNGDARAEQP
jgi:hypothetical protein